MTQTKQCCDCQIEKDLESFAKQKAAKDGRQAKCRACSKIAHDLWVDQNRDKMAIINKNWRTRNPTFREKYKERDRKYALKRAKENPAKANASASAYRAGLRSATPIWVDRKSLELIYQESIRLSKETGIVHHVDHIVPLKGKTVCGLHVPWNLQVIPAVENLRKGNRL